MANANKNEYYYGDASLYGRNVDPMIMGTGKVEHKEPETVKSTYTTNRSVSGVIEYKGSEFYDTGIVYAPYIPIIKPPFTIYGEHLISESVSGYKNYEKEENKSKTTTLKIQKSTVEAGTRKLQTKWSFDMEQDLMKMNGLSTDK